MLVQLKISVRVSRAFLAADVRMVGTVEVVADEELFVFSNAATNCVGTEVEVSFEVDDAV